MCKTPKEIAKLMFENGAKFVLVASKRRKVKDKAVECYLLTKEFIDNYGLNENYAEVIDSTGETVIDYIDGKIITNTLEQ